MTPLQSQLEMVLRQLVIEHRSLLARVEAHELALRSYKPDQIERAAREQEQTRQRIMLLEARRRMIAQALAPRLRNEVPTLAKLAELYPDKKQLLLALRDELKDILEQIQTRTRLASKIASGVLGHLNSTVRLIANAASGPSVYTRSGAAPLPQRVGVIEAVG